MISFDFEYYNPASMSEAWENYQAIKRLGKHPMYYNGGTEFISRARRNEIHVDAIIDLKGIPECSIFKKTSDDLLIGSSISLTTIVESTFFPLLSKVAISIATRTERNKITIGGNIMSHLPYREALLPFLVADSIVHCYGTNGSRQISIHELAQDHHPLEDGEFITHIQTPIQMTNQPFFTVKQTKQSAINYPIVSLAAILHEETYQVACSGLCDFPFRTKSLETMINDQSISVQQRISECLHAIPGPIVDNMQASEEYRLFVFQNTLLEMFSHI